MSLKLRITAWFSLMILLLTALVVSIVFVVASQSLTDDPVDELIETVSMNAAAMKRIPGKHEPREFISYRNGVYCQLFTLEGMAIKGSAPEAINQPEAFENGTVTTCASQQGEFYVYDLRADPFHWIRGYISTSAPSETTQLIILCAIIILPIIVLLSIAGGWLITNRSLKPIDTMLEAAASVNSGDDLSKRIALETGPSELRQLGSEFDKMMERLHRSFDAERQFASDISHELRTPITVALGECHRIRKADDTESCKASAVIIEKQCNRIGTLTESLLHLTRLQQKADTFPLTTQDFSSFLEVCCEDFALERGISQEPQPDQASITLDIENGVSAQYHPDLMSIVIFNLLENARKYSAPAGRIHVQLRSEGNTAVLTVQDNGIGIRPEDLPNIWNRFWQADSSRSRDQGIGLGLAMVKEMVQFQGGTVSAESEFGTMTRFTLRLIKNEKDGYL